MAAKSTKCCCVGCDRPPVQIPKPNTVALPERDASGIWPDSFPDPSPIPVQNLCLSCMPYQLCLSATCNSVTEPSMFTRRDPCDADHVYSYWTGYLYIYEAYASAEIQFDIVDGQCYVCLVCPALGITGHEDDARIALTWDIQSMLSPHCQGCNDEFYPSYALMWNLNLGGYPCSIGASAVSHTSMTPAMPCDECTQEPCAVEAEFYIDESTVYPRSRSCAICLGCDCISTYMCITVRQAGTLIENVNVAICSYSWTTPKGTVVAINTNQDDGTCELRLDRIGGFDFTGYTVDSLPKISSIAGQCPNVSVTFAITATRDSDPSVIKPFNITVASSECGSCSALTSVPCCPEPLPRVLYAIINGGSCSCESLSIPIVETTLTGDTTWIGNSDVDAFCSAWPTKCQVFIQLNCSGGNWILSLRYSTDGGPGYTMYTTYTGSCAPMNLVFTDVNGHGKGDCECSPPFFPKCNNFTVSISE